MNPKITGIILLVLGIIALIGSLLILFMLFVTQSAMGMVNDLDPAVLESYGADASLVKDYIGQIFLVLIAGWLWAISIIVTSIYSIISGIGKIRGKPLFSKKMSFSKKMKKRF